MASFLCLLLYLSEKQGLQKDPESKQLLFQLLQMVSVEGFSKTDLQMCLVFC